MKKFVTLLSFTFSLVLFLVVTVNGQWANNAPHIYNTNAGNVGISNGALWAPAFKLHINTLAAGGVASVMAERNLAGAGAVGFYRILNTSNNEMFNLSLRTSAAGQGEMLQSCRDAFGAWHEYSYFNFNTFKYEMRNGIADAEFLNTGKFLISSVGNTGIGTINPLEKLEVNGAVLIGNTLNNNAGTIAWNGANFMGYNGAGWVALDVQPQPDNDWAVLPNPANGGLQLYPQIPPNQVSLGPPGSPNFCGLLHVPDVVAPGLFPNLLGLESIHGPGVFDASQLYRISNQHNPPFTDFSAGIFGMDLTYKVCSGAVLTPTFQSDNTTMIRALPSGIIDLPNQSRVRAYQQDQLMQVVPSFVWTPVNYNFDAPLPIGYDEQNEFIVAPANAPVPPEMAFFVAAQEGYYQVNARCEFEVYGMLAPGAYVSIAIWTGPGPGATAPYAQGNNLQISTFVLGEPLPLEWNNAPNVSDVVYLMPGQIISIWVFQNSGMPLNLIPGHDKCYVSIHKVS